MCVGGRTVSLFVKSFLPTFKEKQHRKVSHEVWMDPDILENFTRNGTYVIVAQSLSIDYSYVLFSNSTTSKFRILIGNSYIIVILTK